MRIPTQPQRLGVALSPRAAQHRRDQRTATVLAFLIGVAFAAFVCWRGYLDQKRVQLLDEGKRIVKEVEQFRKRTGHYPHSLDEAAVVPADGIARQASYSLDESRGSFSLSVSNRVGSWSYLREERRWEYDPK